MNMGQQVDLSYVSNTLNRWKYLIIGVSIVISTLSVYLAYNLRNVYRSTTVILVTPQQLPSAYVSSTVTLNVEQRVQAILQQIQGRTVLERIVKEFDLFRPAGSKATMEERAERLRRRINIQFNNFNRNNTFSISFDAESPQKAMEVTAKLGSLFIEENLNAREQQATGTTSFLNAEADRLRKELETQERQVDQYRSLYRHELPEQLDSNLRLLDQFRRDLENGTARLSTLQARKAPLEKQLFEIELIGQDLEMFQDLDAGVAGTTRGVIDLRKRELEVLLRKYRDGHPDVLRLKQEIRALEAEKPAEQLKTKMTGSSSPTVNPRFSLKQTLEAQIADLTSEMAAVRALNEKLRGQIASYQTRVDNTPVRNSEIANIMRNYNITAGKYQDLLRKTLDSELSENMEKKQKGEQFQIVDRANLPQLPFAPNRPRIIILGVLLGLGAGLGAAFLLEVVKSSFRQTADIEGYTTVPVLATLPLITSRGQIIARRQEQGLLILASVVLLATGLVLIPLIAPSLPIF